MEVSKKMIEFVRTHENDDVNDLRLKYAGRKSASFEFDLNFALIQIEARNKTKQKIPTFLSHADFFFPTLLSSEQASNEIIAKFHSELIKEADASSVLDLTAGLGIDAMTTALRGINVTACEIDTLKCEMMRHNSKVMGVSDYITVVNEDSIEYIKKINRKYDIIFADPARRDSVGNKVHALSDCQPDIVSSMSDILSIAPRLLVKTSPLLDLTLIKNSVADLNHIYVVCFKGECKEVLIDIKKDSSFDGVTVIDLDRKGKISSFHSEFMGAESLPIESYSDRKNVDDFKYLYEPNAGVMKTGAWATLKAEYPELLKADRNTHIFLSDTLYSNFPGRVMEILSEPDKKALKGLKGTQINIVSRNHPLSAPQISRKYSLISGSNKYLYAFKHNGIPSFIITQPLI